VTHIARICIDPRTDMPLTPSRIESAIKEAGVKIDEKQTAEQQAPHILNTINKLLPIKIVTKKVFMKIPSQYSARIYGIIKPFIIKEEYLSDGSLSAVLQMPKATQIEIYDKVNNIAHGAIITKDLE
jgi:ribosome maturation protein SDO1